jgi:hypothetical protein
LVFLTSVVLLTAGSTASARAAESAGPARAAAASPWTLAETPNPPAGPNLLRDVVGIRWNDAWAVGSSGRDGQNPRSQSLHWDGQAWKPVQTHASAWTSSVLNSVDAVASSDVWAVGRFSRYGGQNKALMMRSSGGSWWDASPALEHATAELHGIDMRTSNDGWAVGSYKPTPNSPRTLNLILHWNGSTWQQKLAPSPGLGVNTLRSVSWVGPRSAWAVGHAAPTVAGLPQETVILRWDGYTWTREPSPNPNSKPGGSNTNVLQNVRAISATDAWAVGHTSGTGWWNRRPLALRWNGQTWKEVTLPVDPQALEFTDVAALSSNDVYLVGWRGRFHDTDFVMRFDGRQLSNETLELPPDPVNPAEDIASALSAVTVVPSSGHLWAVGHVLNTHNQVLQKRPY